ncbi:MAG TPA: alpha/beta hydrolase [Puia sp.]|nr:alpha/beta hydrolase [Puia sp.]
MLRFITIVILLLVSLLAAFPAPAFPLWLLAMIVQGYPWIFVLLMLVLLLAGGYKGRFGLYNALACAFALVLFVSPVVRAYSVARSLGRRLELAFTPPDSPRVARDSSSAFSLGGIFRFGTDQVAYRTLSYDTAEGKPLTLDLYPAQHLGLRPCVVVIHGGAWRSGDSRQLPALNSVLARDGYVVAAINYRLAPRYKSPLQIADVAAAFRYLRSNCARFSIDTSSFVLLGRSAGAQIALEAAYTLNESGLRGVIDLYGPADMVWGYAHPANKWVLDSRKVMADYLGGSYEAVPQQYLRSSPIQAVTTQSVPTLMIHGLEDPLVAYEQSRRLNAKLADSNVAHYLIKLPWATHGFDFNLYGPGGQLSTYAIQRFLREVAP